MCGHPPRMVVGVVLRCSALVPWGVGVLGFVVCVAVGEVAAPGGMGVGRIAPCGCSALRCGWERRLVWSAGCVRVTCGVCGVYVCPI